VFSFTAPSTNGVYTVTANAGGSPPRLDDITVAAAGAVNPVPANSILSASVEANPSVVSVNTSSTSNQSAIRAVFLGANNAPIKDVRVRFDLADDVNSVGGTFTTGNTIVYSSATGEATSAYVPGTRFSPTDGVTVRACYGYVDADVSGTNCAHSVTTPSIDLLRFAKGYWVRTLTEWVRISPQDFSDPNGTPWYLEDPRPLATQISDPSGAPLISSSAACWNEDRNRNGFLEDAEDTKAAGYSLAAGGNGNGKLDPAKADVAISIPGSSRTDASGKVIVRIEYAKNLGSWVEFKILVAASGVGGTEGRATWTDVLGVLASDVKAEGEPAFSVSRYGKLANCADPQ
jgi:hypothetical protein